MRLDYIPLLRVKKLPKLDFRDNNGLDPLGIHHFYHNEMYKYQQSNLSRIVIIKNWKQAIGYLAVSMNAIQVKKQLADKEKVPGTTTTKYPAMLLGRMGVDKKFRKKGIGRAVCEYCKGLAIELSNRVGCRYVILETTNDKTPFYKKCGFTLSEKPPRKGGIMWMYRRIV